MFSILANFNLFQFSATILEKGLFFGSTYSTRSPGSSICFLLYVLHILQDPFNLRLTSLQWPCGNALPLCRCQLFFVWQMEFRLLYVQVWYLCFYFPIFCPSCPPPPKKKKKKQQQTNKQANKRQQMSLETSLRVQAKLSNQVYSLDLTPAVNKLSNNFMEQEFKI